MIEPARTLAKREAIGLEGDGPSETGAPFPTRRHRFPRRRGRRSRIAIVGTGTEARELGGEILARSGGLLSVACFVGHPGGRPGIWMGTPNPGVRLVPIVAPAELGKFAGEHRIGRIVIAPGEPEQLPVDELLRCRTDGYEVEEAASFREGLLGRVSVTTSSPERLILSRAFGRSVSARAVKRAVDVFTACAVLLLTAPLSVIVAVLVKLEDGGPAIFRQQRVGRYGVPFTLLKFRSMTVDAEAETGPTWAQENDPRVTRVGRWIRDLRIDEIPQVWNVLRGEMSFVGPRPERPEFVRMLSTAIPFYDQRHAVRPGITGWAQINFPYGATVDDARHKLEYELYYLKNFSPWKDFSIMLRTIRIVLVGWRGRR